MAKIVLVSKKRDAIRSRPPVNNSLHGISEDTFEWACSMCTHSTYLCAGVEQRVAEKAFRTAYVSIRPAMESALKALWVVGKVRSKSLPESLKPLVSKVEEAFPHFHYIFSIQMSAKDSLGNDVYRKVNGWAHANPEMWTLYKNGQESEHVLKPLRNMVLFAQTELLKYDRTLLDSQKHWGRKYE